MGVITKMFYRGNILNKQRHEHFFLDMEENIHIHYRDLRIELSRGEFEDICDAFRKQSQELQTIIHDKNYQDGKLPNANQEDVRIFTESRLKHDVKYHPQRFSLEECSDGYHFHYRNYKLLLDKAEFKIIASIFNKLNVDSAYATTYDEVLELLEANDVDFSVDAGSGGETLLIAVAPYHFPKIREIFRVIGFTLDAQKYEHHYQGSQLKVIARVNNQLSPADFKRLRMSKDAEGLIDFLVRNATNIDPNEINRIKCQVLDLYFSLRDGKKLNLEIDQNQWLYSPTDQQVIFPYSTTAQGGKDDAKALYETWANFLVSIKLWFVKPTKVVFPAAAQAQLKQQVKDAIQFEMSAFAAVDKVYLMGSALRGDMGYYRAPFVNGPHVKLGSDIDILIELNPARESDIPAHWKLVKQDEPTNRCAIYHITEIPLVGGIGQYTRQYPHLPLIQHLIDAYVFFPSRGHHEEKDAFLAKFPKELFYDRARDGDLNRIGEEERIAQRLNELHNLQNVVVEKLNVATENALYKVFSGTQDYILKLFKVSGNYSRNRIAEHTLYEKKLVMQLKEHGILTAGVIPVLHEADSAIEGCPALLFERLHGQAQLKPEYALDKVCAALAKVHHEQIDRPLKLSKDFSFENICVIWLPLFKQYLSESNLGEEISGALARFVPTYERANFARHRKELYASSPLVHNHGDVTPKNFIMDENGEAIIFDFNNAYFGPRMADVLDGAFEFSLAEQYINLADFARFDAFISNYAAHSSLSKKETQKLPQWIEFVGLIKFTREVRALLEHPGDELRKKRAMAIANYVLSRG